MLLPQGLSLLNDMQTVNTGMPALSDKLSVTLVTITKWEEFWTEKYQKLWWTLAEGKQRPLLNCFKTSERWDTEKKAEAIFI